MERKWSSGVVEWWKREVGVCRGGGFGLFLLTAYPVGPKDTCCRIVSDTAPVMSGRLSGLCSDGFDNVSGYLLGLCSDGLGDVWSPLGGMSGQLRRCQIALDAVVLSDYLRQL